MEIHHQMDKEYQTQLRQINEQAAERMRIYQIEHKKKLECLTMNH